MSTLSQALSNPIVAVMFLLALASLALKAWEVFKKFREAQISRAAQMAEEANAEVASLRHVMIDVGNTVGDLKAGVYELKDIVQIWTTKLAAVENLIVASEATAVRAQTGAAKACEAIAVATDKHRETVAAFSKAVFGEHGREEALQKADDSDRDKVYRQLQYQAAGKSAAEARTLAEDETEHEEAISLSN